MRDELIQLVTKTATGSLVTESTHNVWAERQSVKRTEFYAAYQVGLNPQYTFSINVEDWYAAHDTNGNPPTEVLMDTKHFNIIRAYEKGADVEVVVAI